MNKVAVDGSGNGLSVANFRASATIALISASIASNSSLVRHSAVDRAACASMGSGRALPIGDLVGSSVPGVAHAFGVRAGAIGARFDQGRTLTARARGRLLQPTPRTWRSRRCHRPGCPGCHNFAPARRHRYCGSRTRTALRWRTCCFRRRR